MTTVARDRLLGHFLRKKEDPGREASVLHTREREEFDSLPYRNGILG